MSIIRNMAAWINTDEAVEYVKLMNPDGDFLFRRIDPNGVAMTASNGVTQVSIGVSSTDLVKLGRFLLAVAAAQGQNLNEGFNPGVKIL